jgi:ElaB/YqjD/DUF883 family membrane-anchored ribosome-binding protein
MDNLQDLPNFMAAAGSLEDLRSRVEGYLGNVQNTVSGATAILEQVRNTVTPAPPAPSLVPVPSPIPMPTNPQLEARVRELEASIRQLQAENQRLLTENTQLRSDLAKVTSVLQNLYSLATSSTYTTTLSNLGMVQNETSQLVPWVHGLPHLPPLPPGLTVSQISDAVNKARYLRQIITNLPKLPPSSWPPFIPFPQPLIDLENARQTFISLTTWMDNLQDLPNFMAAAGSLEDLRSRVEGYLGNVQNTVSGATAILEQVRNATGTR